MTVGIMKRLYDIERANRKHKGYKGTLKKQSAPVVSEKSVAEKLRLAAFAVLVVNGEDIVLASDLIMKSREIERKTLPDPIDEAMRVGNKANLYMRDAQAVREMKNERLTQTYLREARAKISDFGRISSEASRFDLREEISRLEKALEKTS